MSGRNIPWGLVALIGLVLLAGAIWFQRVRPARAEDPRQLVREAWTEGRQVPLEGTQIIVMPGPNGKPVEVRARVVTSDQGNMRIEYLTPPLKGVTVWENSEKTYRYNPELKRLTVATKRASLEDPAEELQFLDNYRLKVAGREEIAGRKAVVVELRPKGASSRWKVLSIDRNSGVVLASADREGPEKVLRSTRFEEIRYLKESPDPSAFHPTKELLERYGTARPGDTSSRFAPETLSRLLGFEVRSPSWVPAGYEFKGAYQTPCSCSRSHQAARLVYTDGLNVITLFQCGHGEHDSLENCFSAENGAGMAVAERPVIDGTPWYFLAVGVVPQADLKRMIATAVSQ